MRATRDQPLSLETNIVSSSRLLMLLAAGIIAAATVVPHAQAQKAGAEAPSPLNLRAPASADFDALRARLAPGGIGLKPQPASSWYDATLPFTIDYSSTNRSLIVPLDDKNEWGVGVMLNVYPPHHLDLMTAPALGLQPRRTPGILLQKRF